MVETLHEKHGLSQDTHPKVMSLSTAVERFVDHGSHISVGGFTVSRNPMAAVHEIIRQNIKDLHIYTHSNGQAVDELIGAGCATRAEIAYSGNERFAPTGICFKRHAMDKTLLVEDYSNFQMALRFMAGAIGVPFLPTYASLGTSIIDQWGFDADFRASDPKISNKKLELTTNPFAPEDAPEKVVLVPAINPDVTIIHAQAADTEGTTRILGLTYADVDQVKGSKKVIVTCEEILERGALNDEPSQNQIPSFCVDAVVHAPLGAYPTACYGLYDYDPVFFEKYKSMAANPEEFKVFIQEFVMDTPDHEKMVKLYCGDRLDALMADNDKGYSTRMERK